MAPKPRFTDAQISAAVAEAGSIRAAARALGVPRTSVQDRMARIKNPLPARDDPHDDPVERQSAAFWRQKCRSMEGEHDRLHNLVQQLGGLDGLRIRAPNWMHQAKEGKRGHSTLIVHNSDRHYGEVIRADEISGWNSYDAATCERRVRRFMDAASEVGRRWTSDTIVDGVLYTMGGDEISGDIHEELRETNEFTSLDQVSGAAAMHVAGLRQMAAEYGRVHVMAVPGNHGRTTRKPTAKLYAALSYDTLVARMVAREMQDDERISFQIAAGPDTTALVYGRPILVTHGDKMGTGGGMGFAGPVLPILRGANKVAMQYGSVGAAPYLILMGHYHTSAAPPGILANGSVPGYSEFGATIRAKFDTPRQWLAVMTPRWGLRERDDIALEDPSRPEKPRVRVNWAADATGARYTGSRSGCDI